MWFFDWFVDMTSVTVLIFLSANIFITVEVVFWFLPIFFVAKNFTINGYPNRIWFIHITHLTQLEFRSFRFILKFWFLDNLALHLSDDFSHWWFRCFFWFWFRRRCSQLRFLRFRCRCWFHRLLLQFWLLGFHNHSARIRQWFWCRFLRKLRKFWLGR